MLIDGRDYERPELAELTIGESRVFTEETGLVQDEVLLRIYSDDENIGEELLHNPGFLSALMRIAYKREHPDADDKAIVELVERQDRLTVLASLMPADEEAEDDPKAEGTTSVPNGSSSPSSSENASTPPSNPGSFGKPSETSSVPAVVAQGHIGTDGSDAPSGSVRLERVI